MMRGISLYCRVRRWGNKDDKKTGTRQVHWLYMYAEMIARPVAVCLDLVYPLYCHGGLTNRSEECDQKRQDVPTAGAWGLSEIRGPRQYPCLGPNMVVLQSPVDKQSFRKITS
jgi:hypothetical protein